MEHKAGNSGPGTPGWKRPAFSLAALVLAFCVAFSGVAPAWAGQAASFDPDSGASASINTAMAPLPAALPPAALNFEPASGLGAPLAAPASLGASLGPIAEVSAPAALAALDIRPEAAAAKPPEEGLRNSGLPYRIRGREDLPKPLTRDPLIRVPGAKVAYMNRETLERDFPFTRRLSDQDLERWILDEFAFISKAQHALNGIRNSPIPAPGDLRAPENRKLGLRPPGWRRAAVLSARDARAGPSPPMVDVKGIGHALRTWKERIRPQIARFQGQEKAGHSHDALRDKGHSDGLMSLGEAVAELTRQQAAQKIFSEYNALTNAADDEALQSIETYFIIALPFSILRSANGKDPAALYGRQAHHGRTMNFPVPPSMYTDDHGHFQSDALMTAAVDFGGVKIEDPRLVENFGAEKDPQRSRAWRYAHETAAAFIRGEARAIERHLEAMLKPLARAAVFARFQRPTSALKALEKALWGSNAKVRWTAAEALGQRSDEASRALLEKLLQDQTATLRWIAAKILGWRSDWPSLALIAKALNDKDAATRGAAAQALNRRTRGTTPWPREIKRPKAKNRLKAVTLRNSNPLYARK